MPINQVQRLRFLNPVIESELRRALEVVAGGHDSQKKSVRLGFRGEGKREVKVGYVTENPIWKTSYRIVLDKDGKTKLLGWANVENTSDEDWHDVKLTLVSGRPISFQMDLVPAVVHSAPDRGTGTVRFAAAADLFRAYRQRDELPMAMDCRAASAAVVKRGRPGHAADASRRLAAPNNGGNVAWPSIDRRSATSRNGSTNGHRNPIELGMNRYQNNEICRSMAKQSKHSTANLLSKTCNSAVSENKAQNQSEQLQAKQIGSILTGVDPELIEAALTAEELGNPARFVIEEKVSLPRQQSAMIPILEQPIESTRVSIYNQRVQAKHPLFGLKIKNNSKQSLMQGPIAIYDDEQYAGDARILDLQPGEERFVSYAIDTAPKLSHSTRSCPPLK